MVKLTPAVVYSRTKMSVECVKKLNLWGCEIDDISLCALMKNLQILSLSVNHIKYLEPLKHCEKLEELYLRKNEIEDFGEFEHLSGLKYLRVLWVDENPCTQNIDYRHKVLSILPNLSKLDNKMVTSEERRQGSRVEDPLMSRSMYSVMPTVIDTIIPFSSSPLPVSYNSNSSSSWEDHPGPESLQSDEEHEQASIETSRSNISMMSTSVMGSLMEDENEDNQTWTDFNVDDPPTPVDPVTNPQMFQSLYEGSARQSRSYHLPIMLSQRPIRGLRSMRSHSMSPARQQRIENVISAICVLMDDLDQNGLRTVIEQAQQRIKKQH